MPHKPSKQDHARAFRNALSSDLEQASDLLKRQPDLIDYPVFGESESALHFFAVEKRADVVAWLIEHGADPNGIADDDTPLHGAASLGHDDVCKLLLEAGADPNGKDYSEETPLHKAATKGHLGIIESLLSSGADPSIRDMCDERPIDQALARKRDEIQALFDRHSK